MRFHTISQIIRPALFFLATISATAALAAPITFNGALPLSDEQFIIRQQIISTTSENEQLKINTLSSVTAIGYGVSAKLAVFGIVPIIRRETQSANTLRTTSGLADINLFARYQIYQKDGPGKTLRIAPFAGVVLPTGRAQQTGDGSTDIFGGLIITRASTRWNFDSQIKYVRNGRVDALKRGDETSINASLQYRINSNVNVNTNGYLFTVIEAGLVHSGRNERAVGLDPNSGGTIAFISPGIQYAAQRWISEAAIRFPVIKNLNGSAPQPAASFIISARFNF